MEPNDTFLTLKYYVLDLRGSSSAGSRCIEKVEIEKHVKELRARFPSVVGYRETSALTQDGVKHCFDTAVCNNNVI